MVETIGVFSFNALVCVGDGMGRVGVGLGKSNEISDAIRKAGENAKRSMIRVPMMGGTIPFLVFGKFGAGRVMLKPATPGTGVIAGGAVRAIMESAGVRDVLAKSLGSTNPHNLITVRLDDGAAYLVDWINLTRLTNAGIIGAAKQAVVPGARVVVTGLRIRNVAEIRQLAPKFKGDVDPNTVEARSIRRVDDSFNWTPSPSAYTPNCDGK